MFLLFIDSSMSQNVMQKKGFSLITHDRHVKNITTRLILYHYFDTVYMYVSHCLIFDFRRLINFVENKAEKTYMGYVYASTLMVLITIQSFLLQQYFSRNYTAAMQIKTSIIALVYRKVRLDFFSFYCLISYIYAQPTFFVNLLYPVAVLCFMCL